MANIKIKEIVEAIGGLAVIISLLLVASELRQANNIALRDSRVEINNIQYDQSRLAFESERFASVREKLREADPQLTSIESELALDWAMMNMANWGNISASIDADLLPSGTADVWIQTAVSLVNDFPGIIPFIRTRANAIGLGRGYSPLFDAVLDAMSE